MYVIDLVFSAKTSGSEEWKAVISAISTLVEEATFEATVEGISFRGMDPSHVALIDISWPNLVLHHHSSFHHQSSLHQEKFLKLHLALFPQDCLLNHLLPV